jgi:hypothetical protein
MKVRREFIKFDKDWTPKMDSAIDEKSAKEIDGYMHKIDQILRKAETKNKMLDF